MKDTLPGITLVAPGATATIDGGVIGYPLISVEKIPAGDYYVQAVLNVYETFQRADGFGSSLGSAFRTLGPWCCGSCS